MEKYLYGIQDNTNSDNGPLYRAIFSDKQKAEKYIDHMCFKQIYNYEEGSYYDTRYTVVSIPLDPYCSDGYVSGPLTINRY